MHRTDRNLTMCKVRACCSRIPIFRPILPRNRIKWKIQEPKMVALWISRTREWLGYRRDRKAKTEKQEPVKQA